MEGMYNTIHYVADMIKDGQLSRYQVRIAMVDACLDYGPRKVWGEFRRLYPELAAWLEPDGGVALLDTFPEECKEPEEPEEPDDIPLLPDGHFDFLDEAC